MVGYEVNIKAEAVFAGCRFHITLDGICVLFIEKRKFKSTHNFLWTSNYIVSRRSEIDLAN